MHQVPKRNDKTSSPLQYILQAAMGQCSTMAADGNKESGSEAQVRTTAPSNNKSPRGSYTRGHSASSRKSQREQRDSIGYRNGRPSDDERHDNDDDVVMGEAYVPNDRGGRNSRDKAVFRSEDDVESSSGSKHLSYNNRSARQGRSKIHCEPTRDEILPPPPPGSVRTRCYRLNLDAPVILSPTHDHLGPMPYEPPVHLLPQRSSEKIKSSMSTDSSERNPTQVAINTARIFRGITVDKNGTILSQNARATRSSRGKEKSKQAASSRQQEKINKAKDLVDESGGFGGKENDKEKSNMVSLVIIGEYDEMKQLVRDGAKKLRDAEGLPDDALLAINRPRQSSPRRSLRSAGLSSSGSSSRKRFSSPSQVQSPVESPDSRSRSRNRLQQTSQTNSAPKLRGHPRDRPSSRRIGSPSENGNGERRRFSGGEKCNDMSIFGGGDSDWSDALGLSRGFDTIWNCGATGTGSPNNKNSNSSSVNGRRSSKVRYEGRNESSSRLSRGTAERDAPVTKDVMIL